VRRNPAAAPDPEWIGYSSDTDGEGPPPQTVPMPWPMLGRQDDYRDQTKHSAIARLGRFSTQLPGLWPPA
jgi:hypothetical protein